MRETKFRVWNEEFKSFDTLLKDDYYGDGNIGFVDCFVGNEEDIWEQFTGLYDNNGNEIYEGDIVKLHVVILSPDDKVGYIEYRPEFGYCINFGGKVARQEYWAANDKHTIEVIGNIHENKELLDGGNNQD